MDRNLCVDKQNFTISGTWTDSYISVFSVRIAICVNTTEGDNCAPYNEIIDYLQTTIFFWNIYLQTTNFNADSTTNSITYNLLNIYKSIKINTKKITEIYIKQLERISVSMNRFLDNVNECELVYQTYATPHQKLAFGVIGWIKKIIQ